jgi:hypothetical protein
MDSIAAEPVQASHADRGTLAWARASGVRVALGIVAVSILGSVVTWRAAEWSDRAGRYEQLAIQDVAFRHQIQAQQQTLLDEDERVFGDYEQHLNLALRLEHDAWRVSDPAQARTLLGRAQSERAVADAELTRIRARSVDYAKDGTPSYDAAAAREGLAAGDPDLALLNRSPYEELAATAQNRAGDLVGLALIFASSLVFLTLAQLTRPPLTRAFALLGTVVAVLAAVLFALA